MNYIPLTKKFLVIAFGVLLLNGGGCSEAVLDELGASDPGAVEDLAKGSNTRLFKIHDSEYYGTSFDLSIDGEKIGTSPINGTGEFSKDLSVGVHKLQIRALNGGASRVPTAWVTIFSGMRHPCSFVEPQAIQTQCGLYFGSEIGGPDLTGLGKVHAECTIPEGKTVELLFNVGEYRK